MMKVICRYLVPTEGQGGNCLAKSTASTLGRGVSLDEEIRKFDVNIKMKKKRLAIVQRFHNVLLGWMDSKS